MKNIIIAFLLIAVMACQTNQVPERPIERGVIGQKAMVVSAHPLASQVGKEIMEKGGNAVDAVIAVQFALAVVYPGAGNIGGGGFMVARMADGTTDALDYREKAPLSGGRDMYLDQDENVIDGLSVRGASADGHSARARAESATAVCARRHVPTGRELPGRERRGQSV